MSILRDAAILIGFCFLGIVLGLAILWAIMEPIGHAAGWHDPHNPELIKKALTR